MGQREEASFPSPAPEGDSPTCPVCRAPLVPRDDGDGRQWTHQCPECGQVYRVGGRVKALRRYDDKQLRPTDSGPAVGGVKPGGEHG